MWSLLRAPLAARGVTLPFISFLSAFMPLGSHFTAQMRKPGLRRVEQRPPSRRRTERGVRVLLAPESLVLLPHTDPAPKGTVRDQRGTARGRRLAGALQKRTPRLSRTPTRRWRWVSSPPYKCGGRGRGWTRGNCPRTFSEQSSVCLNFKALGAPSP